MPHLNLNWAGVTTLSMRTCCKAVSGECLCDALSWSALPTPSGRTGNTKTTDYCHPAAPGFTDTVCLRNILWGLGAINKTLQALSQCTATSLRLDGKNLHWRRMWKEVHILFQCCDRAWIARVVGGKIFETNIVMEYLWVNVIFVGLDPSWGRIKSSKNPSLSPRYHALYHILQGSVCSRGRSISLNIYKSDYFSTGRARAAPSRLLHHRRRSCTSAPS